jgi:hypothetical protein
MMPTTDGEGGGRRRIATGEAWFLVCPGGRKVATKERHGGHGRLAFQHQSRIGLLVCQMEELLA